MTQFQRNAAVRRTRISAMQWRRDQISCGLLSPLCSIPCFSILRCWADALHALDLGVYGHVCANVLLELVEACFGMVGRRGNVAMRLMWILVIGVVF